MYRDLVNVWPPEKSLTVFSFFGGFVRQVDVYPGDSQKWSAETIKEVLSSADWLRTGKTVHLGVCLPSLSDDVHVGEVMASISQHLSDTPFCIKDCKKVSDVSHKAYKCDNVAFRNLNLNHSPHHGQTSKYNCGNRETMAT